MWGEGVTWRPRLRMGGAEGGKGGAGVDMQPLLKYAPSLRKIETTRRRLGGPQPLKIEKGGKHLFIYLFIYSASFGDARPIKKMSAGIQELSNSWNTSSWRDFSCACKTW